mgnify:CR=1 FL=1
MIYEAKAMGADAVLLICAILTEEELRSDLELAERLGLSALVETHSEEEIEMAKRCQAKIIGVNNRDLHTFQVELQTSASLRRLVPPEIIFVSESGIRTPEDIRLLKENGTDAVLIGETLMREPDKGKRLPVLGEWTNENENQNLRIEAKRRHCICERGKAGLLWIYSKRAAKPEKYGSGRTERAFGRAGSGDCACRSLCQ